MVDNKYAVAYSEVLEILKYNQSDKDIRSEISPFKPMQEPKKISMVGRVFYNSADKDDNNNYVNPDNINDIKTIELTKENTIYYKSALKLQEMAITLNNKKYVSFIN